MGKIRIGAVTDVSKIKPTGSDILVMVVSQAQTKGGIILPAASIRETFPNCRIIARGPDTDEKFAVGKHVLCGELHLKTYGVPGRDEQGNMTLFAVIPTVSGGGIGSGVLAFTDDAMEWFEVDDGKKS